MKQKYPRKSTTRGRACFDKVVLPRQDILEQTSTVTAQNRCPKIRRDKRCCNASILATGQRLHVFYNNSSANISPQLPEPTDIFRAALHHRSHCLFALHFHQLVVNLYFSVSDTGQTIISHKKMPNSPGAYTFYEKITGNSVAEPSTISLFSIDQPTPQVIQTRSYTFTNYLFGEKTVKRLESSM